MNIQLLVNPDAPLAEDRGGKVKLENVYEVYMGVRAGLKVWVVDWHFVAANLWSEFLMGGNDQRYRFNPEGEAWIDSTMGIEEYEYTLEHEVLERHLMRQNGWSYDRAHDYATEQLDGALRARNKARIERKLSKLGKDSDFGPKVDKLNGIYRAYVGKRQGAELWIVDGPRVRENLWQDFGFPGACDLSLGEFIPPGDIWFDSATSCGTLRYALVQQLAHRRLMGQRLSYSEAYVKATEAREKERKRQARLCARHEARLMPVRVGARDRGVKPKSE